jgi:transposase
MLGTQTRDFAPIVDVSLEDLVPADHFYRHLEHSLDLTFVRDLVQPYYATGGRPSIDPVVFFKLQLVMFFEGMRSERQLLRVAADRLSLRWYLGYDLTEPLPDHSSLTRIRDRYGVVIFRRFFDAIVEQCQQAGLVWGQELYVDATKVEANAALDSVLPRFAVDAHLAQLFPEEVPTLEEETPIPAYPLSTHLPAERLEKLAQANATRHDWLVAVGHQNRAVTSEGYQRRADVEASRTDPDASIMPQKQGFHLGYHTHYVVDGGKARIILAALVTPSEVMENQPMRDLVWRIRFRWQLHPHFVCGDTTYGTIENIVALEAEGIQAYMPLPDFGRRTPFYGKQRFTYDVDQDQYRCPHGALLPRRKVKSTERVIVYQADAETCNGCPLKANCTASDRGRQVHRSFDEAYLDRVRSYHSTEPYKKAMRKRKIWVEPLFGEAKAWHGLARFRLRLLEQVNIEALVIATGQNLKRWLSWRGWRQRSWPGGAAGVVILGIFCTDSMVPVKLANERAWMWSSVRPQDHASLRL